MSKYIRISFSLVVLSGFTPGFQDEVMFPGTNFTSPEMKFVTMIDTSKLVLPEKDENDNFKQCFGVPCSKVLFTDKS